MVRCEIKQEFKTHLKANIPNLFVCLFPKPGKDIFDETDL